MSQRTSIDLQCDKCSIACEMIQKRDNQIKKILEKVKRYENVSAQYIIKFYLRTGFIKIKNTRGSIEYISSKKAVIDRRKRQNYRLNEQENSLFQFISKNII